jgi:hypothetical protein
MGGHDGVSFHRIERRSIENPYSEPISGDKLSGDTYRAKAGQSDSKPVTVYSFALGVPMAKHARRINPPSELTPCACPSSRLPS